MKITTIFSPLVTAADQIIDICRSDCYDGEGLTPDYQVENEDENYDAQLATASQLARTAESGE